MALVVGDVILIKDKIGSKGPSNIIGDIIANTSDLGTRGSNYIVGDEISIWDKLGVKTASSFSLIPNQVKSEYYHGFGYFMWELIIIMRSPTKTDLGLYIVKRATNSDNLEIGDITHIELDDDDPRIEWNESFNQYTFVDPVYTNGYNQRSGCILCTDTLMYFFVYADRSIYLIDKITGEYTLVGTFPVTSTISTFDGEYIYSYKTSPFMVYKVSLSTLSVVASIAGSDYKVPPFFIVGNKIWITRGTVGYAGTLNEHNVSDLSLTGDTTGGLYLDEGSNIGRLSSNSQTYGWFYGVCYSGFCAGTGWHRWLVSTGYVTPVITIESPYSS
jgi:hypothetical protein